MPDVIYGIHAVIEALKSRGRAFEYVGVARERNDQKVQRIVDDCRSSGVPVRFISREDLDRIARTPAHQGIVAVTSQKQYLDLEDILRSEEHTSELQSRQYLVCR